MYGLRGLGAAMVALLVGSSAASATTITVQTFDVNDFLTILGDYRVVSGEDFEGFDLANLDDGSPIAHQEKAFDGSNGNGVISTKVGEFTTVGGVGSGGTVTQPNPDLDGSELAVRKGNVYGRSSTTDDLFGNKDDDQFLDSNDTHGIEWSASFGGSAFDYLMFVMTDHTDVGAKMTITAGPDAETLTINPKLKNGTKQVVFVAFDTEVTSASILFENNKKNDGFSIDDAYMLAAVPLPAPVLMLLAGVGALGAVRRRKRN